MEERVEQTLPPPGPPSASYWPVLCLRHVQTHQWRRVILRGGPGPSSEWAAGQRSSPAAPPPSRRCRCSHRRSRAAPRAPQPLAPPGLGPRLLPRASSPHALLTLSPPRFLSYLKGRKKKTTQNPTTLLWEFLALWGGKKPHKTRHGPGPPLLKAWPTRGGPSPGREAPQISPTPRPGVASLGPGPLRPAPAALGPPPAPAASHPVPALSPEPGRHPSH